MPSLTRQSATALNGTGGGQYRLLRSVGAALAGLDPPFWK
jgi:hypothetical protein